MWIVIPKDYVQLLPDTVLEAGDEWTMPSDPNWYEIAQGLVGLKVSYVQNYTLFHWRRYVGPDKAFTQFWYCNSATCRNRENDVGSVCYWCGAPESIQNKKEEKSND